MSSINGYHSLEWFRSTSPSPATSRRAAPPDFPDSYLPAGLTSAGLPVAVELDAAAGTDRALLGLGTSLAQVLGPIPLPRFTVSTALAT